VKSEDLFADFDLQWLCFHVQIWWHTRYTCTPNRFTSECLKDLVWLHSAFSHISEIILTDNGLKF